MKSLPSLLCWLLFCSIQVFGADPLKIVFVSGEYEYFSRETLPPWAERLSREYQVQTVFLSRPEDPKIESIEGLEQLETADMIVLFIRRMTLPPQQLDHFKKYVRSGKPLLGLRTASHAFENWPEFDATVLGGNYGRHHGNALKTSVSLVPEQRDHPILRGVTPFVSEGSLYRNTPLQPGARPLLTGAVTGKAPEPVAWTHTFQGARVFYTSLGHPRDFQEESFLKLVHNAIEWALERPLVKRAVP